MDFSTEGFSDLDLPLRIACDPKGREELIGASLVDQGITLFGFPCVS